MLVLAASLAVLSACGGSDGEDTPTAPPAAGAPTPGVAASATGYAGGVIAVSHPLAAQVGADVLAQGGNAFDAAAAIQFALNVVEPQSSGLGGGAFMVAYVAKEGRVVVLDGREKAPAAATPTMFGKLSFEDASTTGISVGVPGTLQLFGTALKQWGTWTLARTLAPATALADEGFVVNASLAADIVNTSDRGFQMTHLQPETAALFRPGGVPLKAGDRLRNPDLAKTFRLIAAQGPDVFYKGEIARAIVEAQTRASTTGAAGAALTQGAAGRMTLADLANYNVAQRQPLMGSYRGYTVATMPAPSSGGVTVLQQLKMLEQFPLGDRSKGFGFGEKNTLHVLIEGMRLSFADRNAYLGDADFVKVPVAGLLDGSYLAARGALVKLDSALPLTAIKPGNPFPRDTALAAAASAAARTAGDPKEGTHTTHFVVADREGNVVSLTTTVESLFGSGILVPGYGFLLNNELTDFNWPPSFNLASGDIGANDVAPYKRPRSSMTPTLLLKDGKPFAALGSAGGARIINAVVQITSNLIDHGMSVEQAIDAPRLSARTSDTVFCEAGPFTPTGFTPTPAFAPSVVSALNAMREPAIGMPACSGNESNGANLSAQALVIDWNTGLKYGAADKRRQGTVAGVR
jgi:gamma-glutamyltranspeptidase/glutathione hydrolase